MCMFFFIHDTHLFLSIVQVVRWTKPDTGALRAGHLIASPVLQLFLHCPSFGCSTTSWKEFTAPDGRKYYYNKTTKVSASGLRNSSPKNAACAAALRPSTPASRQLAGRALMSNMVGHAAEAHALPAC